MPLLLKNLPFVDYALQKIAVSLSLGVSRANAVEIRFVFLFEVFFLPIHLLIQKTVPYSLLVLDFGLFDA